MFEKVVVAASAIAFVLFVSTATAGPPGAETYVPPQSQQATTDDTKGANPPNQGHNQPGVATPNVATGAPSAAADPQRRLSYQQTRAMRACIRNCIAAGMSGPFCSHSCIPD